MAGDIVDGTVSRVEPYGLYVDTSEGPALVLVVDVSNTKPMNLPEEFEPGDKVRLRLLRYIEEKGYYKASMLDQRVAGG